ncbi:hypothetical protein H4219_004354 [Mycoemilia scoparia]|uniref:Transcription regulator Rua1 C-terminal domain-containing protein n=1 Tax=Mycoemilia scoparia TaxID=417184 RepID=A0A9W7ZWG0_9FUNG|nr:hypothetical protein H4219_004354 [Mycoemilia scoparia]
MSGRTINTRGENATSLPRNHGSIPHHHNSSMPSHPENTSSTAQEFGVLSPSNIYASVTAAAAGVGGDNLYSTDNRSSSINSTTSPFSYMALPTGSGPTAVSAVADPSHKAQFSLQESSDPINNYLATSESSVYNTYQKISFNRLNLNQFDEGKKQQQQDQPTLISTSTTTTPLSKVSSINNSTQTHTDSPLSLPLGGSGIFSFGQANNASTADSNSNSSNGSSFMGSAAMQPQQSQHYAQQRQAQASSQSPQVSDIGAAAAVAAAAAAAVAARNWSIPSTAAQQSHQSTASSSSPFHMLVPSLESSGTNTMQNNNNADMSGLQAQDGSNGGNILDNFVMPSKSISHMSLYKDNRVSDRLNHSQAYGSSSITSPPTGGVVGTFGKANIRRGSLDSGALSISTFQTGGGFGGAAAAVSNPSVVNSGQISSSNALTNITNRVVSDPYGGSDNLVSLGVGTKRKSEDPSLGDYRPSWPSFNVSSTASNTIFGSEQTDMRSSQVDPAISAVYPLQKRRATMAVISGLGNSTGGASNIGGDELGSRFNTSAGGYSSRPYHNSSSMPFHASTSNNGSNIHGYQGRSFSHQYQAPPPHHLSQNPYQMKGPMATPTSLLGSADGFGSANVSNPGASSASSGHNTWFQPTGGFLPLQTDSGNTPTDYGSWTPLSMPPTGVSLSQPSLWVQHHQPPPPHHPFASRLQYHRPSLPILPTAESTSLLSGPIPSIPGVTCSPNPEPRRLSVPSKADMTTPMANGCGDGCGDHHSHSIEDMLPRKQKIRFIDDLYTPLWVRGSGEAKEGLCDTCKPGKWLQLKNSAFWYHKQFHHGVSSVSGRPFIRPLQARHYEPELIEGLCHQCRQWVPIANMKRKSGVLWFRHAHKCHVYHRPKVGRHGGVDVEVDPELFKDNDDEEDNSANNNSQDDGNSSSNDPASMLNGVVGHDSGKSAGGQLNKSMLLVNGGGTIKEE